LEIGAVGEEGGDVAGEGEVGEGELVDSAIVAGGSCEVGCEAIAGRGKGGSSPISERVCGIGERGVEVAEA